MKNNETLWFDEPTKLEKIQNDPNHQYLWGGCYLNRNTGYIDFIYHKRTDKTYNVEFVPASTIGYFNVILENERAQKAIIGIIKNDWTKYQEHMKGGSFFLEGISKSMEKVYKPVVPVVEDENFLLFFG